MLKKTKLMPSGETHKVIELIIGPFIFMGLLICSLQKVIPLDWPFIAVAALGYLVGTFFLSPDLDLFKSDGISRWGPFRYIWWPYAQICAHRGISHSWLFGTLTRVGYLFLFVIPILFIHPPILSYWPFVLAFFIGCWSSNAIHLAADGHFRL